MAFDFKAHPELRDEQLDIYYWQSPHKQIFEDFWATVKKVHDGDTITVQWVQRDFDFPIRFALINAPELSEAGGHESQSWLETQILNEEVLILINKANRVDKWGRLIGTIIHRGLDMNEAAVLTGHAKPFTQRNESKLPKLEEFFSIKQWLNS